MFIFCYVKCYVKIIMSKCKYIKQKIDRTLYCKILNRKITFKECSGCEHKEYNFTKKQPVKNNKTIAKLERNRFSILTNDLTKCIVCGTKKEHLHEVFSGRNRINSMKYGCVIPLCSNCHQEMHKNIELSNYYKVLSQQKFIELYPHLDFIEIFKKNYL